MTTELAHVIEGIESYALAPVTGPEDIQDAEIRGTVQALVLGKGGQSAIKDIAVYEPTQEPENEDPRGLMRKTWDNLYGLFLPRTKKVQLARRIKQQRQISHAQELYLWAEQNKNGVVTSLQSLRKAHDGISTFVRDTEYGVERLQEGLERAEARVTETVEYIKRLEGKISSDEYKSDLEDQFGVGAAQQALEEYRSEQDACRKGAAQIGQVREYADALVKEFSGDVAASKQSLIGIREVMKETTPLRLKLEVTLRRYQGLTANEIDASQATQFLQDMRGVIGGINDNARKIHTAWTAQAETFVMTTDQPYEQALPDVGLLEAPKEEYES